MNSSGITRDGVKATSLPFGLGLFDPLRLRRYEVPPDMARPVHRLAASENTRGRLQGPMITSPGREHQ